MPEEEKPQEPEKPEVKEKSEDTVKTLDNIDRANEAAVRLEKANEEKTKLLDREERMKVEERLGGKTEAGQEPEKKEESPEDYADRVMGGNVEKQN